MDESSQASLVQQTGDDGSQTLEDLVAEATTPVAQWTVEIDGSTLSKLHALALVFKYHGSSSSAGHLKQI